MLKHASLLFAAAALSACASTPNVEYTYYLPTSTTTVTLAQTVSCTKDNDALVISYAAPTIATVYAADPKKGHTLPLQKLDSVFVDVDFSFNVTDDGRLKSINASWTGQGETILKSAINLGTTLAVLGGGAKADHKLTECATIDQWGGGKSVTLTYTASLNLARDKNVELKVAGDRTSKEIYKGLKAQLPSLFVVVTPSDMPEVVAFKGSKNDYKYFVTLPNIVKAHLEVQATDKPIYMGDIIVPGDSSYDLPIPDPEPFGTEKFALTLSDAGAVNTIDYGKSTGAAGPMNAAGAVATTLAPAPSQ